jgi:hypothetical protein
MRCDGRVRLIRGRVAWIGSVVLAVTVVTVVLLVITAKKDDDFWRLAVPTYLTGVGTLALAVLNVMLLRQEASDRKALGEAQAQRDRDDALREARKVIPGVDPNVPAALIQVLNAGFDEHAVYTRARRPMLHRLRAAAIDPSMLPTSPR